MIVSSWRRIESWRNTNLAQAPNGLWLYGTTDGHGDGISSAPISIWSGEAYESREEAIEDARRYLLQRFEDYWAHRSCSETGRDEVRQVIAILVSQKP